MSRVVGPRSAEGRGWIQGTSVNGDIIASSGAFGHVCTGKGCGGESDCVLKIMRKVLHGGHMTPGAYKRELEIMKFIKKTIHDPNKTSSPLYHDAIVEFIEGWEEPYIYVFAMEHLKGGDLFAWLNNRDRANEFTVQSLLKPVFEAIALLHSRKILHLDLKLENLSFRDEEKTQLVIVDLGLAYQLRWPGEPDLEKPKLGYYKKMQGIYPSEVMDRPQDPILSPAVDVYCLGNMLYALITGDVRFPHTGSRRRPSVPLCWRTPVDDAEFENLLGGNALPTEEVKDLIKKMLEPDREKRISMEDVLQHPWFSLPEIAQQYELPVLSRETTVEIRREESEGVAVREKWSSLRGKILKDKRLILSRLAQKTREISKRQGVEGRLVTLNENSFGEVIAFGGLEWLLADPNTGKINVRHIFDLCNTRCDAIVDYQEMTILLMCTGLFSAKDILGYFTFTLLDDDDSGRIDKTELAAALGYTLLESGSPLPAALPSPALLHQPHPPRKPFKRASSHNLTTMEMSDVHRDMFDLIWKVIDQSPSDEYISRQELEAFADTPLPDNPAVRELHWKLYGCFALSASACELGDGDGAGVSKHQRP